MLYPCEENPKLLAFEMPKKLIAHALWCKLYSNDEILSPCGAPLSLLVFYDGPKPGLT